VNVQVLNHFGFLTSFLKPLSITAKSDQEENQHLKERKSEIGRKKNDFDQTVF